MERLTFGGNFCDIAQCRELPCKYDGNCSQKQVWERLKAYEDAGLSPQACAEAREIEKTLSGYDYSISRMVELMKTDVEGRVLILPCNGYSDIEIVRKGISYKPDHWNIHLTAFAHGQNTPSGLKVGLFDIVEVERAMEEMEGKNDG
jgi:hypothetical protein